MKKKKLVIGLFILFICLLSLTIYTSFSSNIDTQEIVIKSMVPVYDETSTIVVDNENVIFNDKNQVVDYKVVLENTQDYDVKITDIKLTTPTEEFLQYTVEDLQKDDVLAANSTKELTISLETMGIKGWGRNFADELTANISFEKVVKEVTPPAEETPKEEDKQPEAPATNIEEVINKTAKIEIEKITNNTIEFKDGIKLEYGEKAETWIYPETEFYGYKEADESNTIKEIVLEKDKLDKLEITPGEHNIVLSTEEKEVLGYVNIYINEEKELLTEKTQEEDGNIEPPNTSDKGLLVVLIVSTGVTGLGIILVTKNKFAKYTIFVIALSSSLALNNDVNAEKVIELPIKVNASFESQNVMSQSSQEEVCYDYTGDGIFEWCDINYHYFWEYSKFISTIYIQNEILEINNYTYAFDVTEEQNGRVMAYLVKKDDGSVCNGFSGETDACYDLYLQADGVIYANKNASYYFANMLHLDFISNFEGLDTSNVENMSSMFNCTGYKSENFTLDLSNFDTSKVTDMSVMFVSTGQNSTNFTLDVSNFDTSKVTDMKGMFSGTGYNNPNFTLDLSNFDTSKVTDMSDMFNSTGYNSTNFTLDVSNFDTSNVTDMSYMFSSTGYNSENFTLDVSNFDTSKVTDMSGMFQNTGFNSQYFTLDVSNFDTSNVTDMSYMFSGTGYNSTNFTLDVSNFDTSNVTNMDCMFRDTGYNSTKFNTSITIKNPNLTSYDYTFSNVATKEGSQIKVNYTEETDLLVSKMIDNPSFVAHIVKGDCIGCSSNYVPVKYYPIGTEIDINGEKFNIISQTEDTITMLAQYNIGTDNKQSTTHTFVKFSDASGWEYTPRSDEIDIWEWSPYTSELVDNYVSYLQTELGNTIISGNLITLTELEGLGCSTPICSNSPYYSWLINGQHWWTRSAWSEYVRFVSSKGRLDGDYYSNTNGVRPVITISKETLKNLG